MLYQQKDEIKMALQGIYTCSKVRDYFIEGKEPVSKNETLTQNSRILLLLGYGKKDIRKNFRQAKILF